jgi:hypothetical protein
MNLDNELKQIQHRKLLADRIREILLEDNWGTLVFAAYYSAPGDEAITETLFHGGTLKSIGLLEVCKSDILDRKTKE